MKTNHTAMITGSTGGIGLEVSKLLAAKGWNLLFLNRSQEKSAKQIAELKEAYPVQTFQAYTANLMDLSDIVQALEQIESQHTELAALYHVAGLLTDKRLTSAQGAEGHFAINTLAPYLITQRLRKQLSAGSSADQKSVVVNFSSSAIHSVKKLQVSALLNPPEIGGLMGAYAKTKLAITIVTEFLQEELSHEGILIQSADPGPTKTPMTGGGDGMPWFVSLLQPLLFKDPLVQAQKLVTAVDASVSDGASGLFISEGKRKATPPIVSDQELQSELKTFLDSQIEKFL
ncbi:MAG: SDR family NAD(P)-dependent oxidoreductase [Verrucomicrobiota bacterium]